MLTLLVAQSEDGPWKLVESSWKLTILQERADFFYQSYEAVASIEKILGSQVPPTPYFKIE